MPDPRDVLVSALIFVGTFVWIVGGSRFGPRAWGWLCERVARAAYQRGYAAAEMREGNRRYLDGRADGWRDCEATFGNAKARAQLVAPVVPAGSDAVKTKLTFTSPDGAFRGFGGRLGRQLRDTHHPPAPPPGFNDSEGDEG